MGDLAVSEKMMAPRSHSMMFERMVIALWLLLAGVAVAADTNRDPFETLGLPRPAESLGQEASAVLVELTDLNFHTLAPVQYAWVPEGDAEVLEAVRKNNALWLRLLRTCREQKGTLCLRTTWWRTEGMPSMTHWTYVFYVVINGRFRMIQYKPEAEFYSLSKHPHTPVTVLECDTLEVGYMVFDKAQREFLRHEAVDADYAGDQVLGWLPARDLDIRVSLPKTLSVLRTDVPGRLDS